MAVLRNLNDGTYLCHSQSVDNIDACMCRRCLGAAGGTCCLETGKAGNGPGNLGPGTMADEKTMARVGTMGWELMGLSRVVESCLWLNTKCFQKHYSLIFIKINRHTECLIILNLFPKAKARQCRRASHHVPPCAVTEVTVRSTPRSTKEEHIVSKTIRDSYKLRCVRVESLVTVPCAARELSLVYCSISYKGTVFWETHLVGIKVWQKGSAVHTPNDRVWNSVYWWPLLRKMH